jgi:hypothetical protein
MNTSKQEINSNCVEIGDFCACFDRIGQEEAHIWIIKVNNQIIEGSVE